MAENRSFTRYVTDRFYNNFYSAVEAYIGENPDRLDLNIRNVRTVGGVALAEMEIKFVSISDLPEMEIEFDVIVEGEIVVGEGDYHYDDFDQCYQWFILRCRGDLALSLDDFKINSIDTYNQKNKMDKPISDALVPYIYKEDLDKVATDFLRRYYPEALNVPMSLDPLLLAEKMGLDVKLHDITEDLSIFGQVYFHDSEAEIYDSDAEEYISTSVKARTIFVDPKAYFLRNLGAVNNTIVHECVHWDKHRKAFELERLYNSSASKIKCQVAGGVKDSNRDATDWMEWQANALPLEFKCLLVHLRQKPLSELSSIAIKWEPMKSLM